MRSWERRRRSELEYSSLSKEKKKAFPLDMFLFIKFSVKYMYITR
jgi:hypothetical protein